MKHENLLIIIGKNIKDARNEKEMKGETLAKALKVDKSYVSQMEHGKVDFRISVLQSIADILETDICKLLPIKIIESVEELHKMPSHEKIILIRMVIDQLITQMQDKKMLDKEW